jgi:VanZ family protein
VRPQTGAPHALEHFAIFWATGFAAGIGWQRRQTLAGFFLILFAGLVEIAQLFVPGRHARWSDFTVDASAAIIGLCADGAAAISPHRSLNALGWRQFNLVRRPITG